MATKLEWQLNVTAIIYITLPVNKVIINIMVKENETVRELTDQLS